MGSIHTALRVSQHSFVRETSEAQTTLLLDMRAVSHQNHALDRHGCWPSVLVFHSYRLIPPKACRSSVARLSMLLS